MSEPLCPLRAEQAILNQVYCAHETQIRSQTSVCSPQSDTHSLHIPNTSLRHNREISNLVSVTVKIVL